MRCSPVSDGVPSVTMNGDRMIRVRQPADSQSVAVMRIIAAGTPSRRRLNRGADGSGE